MNKETAKELTWSCNASAVFTALEALVRTTLPTHPQREAPASIITDASDSILWKLFSSSALGLGSASPHFSKKLMPLEIRYMTSDRELLGVLLTTEYFLHFVKGCQFHTLTNHKPSHMHSYHRLTSLLYDKPATLISHPSLPYIDIPTSQRCQLIYNRCPFQDWGTPSIQPSYHQLWKGGNSPAWGFTTPPSTVLIGFPHLQRHSCPCFYHHNYL